MDPITTGAIIGGLVEGGKALFGAGQRSRAKRALKRLEKERPKGYIPSAILERANEPIAEEFVEAQEMGDQRLTSQGIGALQSGGSRAILGGLPNLMDTERQRRMQRTGQYEQARRDALGMKGAAQERIRQEERQDWQNQVAAQAAELGAAQQNISQGLTGIGEAALLGAMGKGFGKMASKETPPDIKLPDDDLLGSSVMDDPKLEEAGIEMDFKKPQPTLPDGDLLDNPDVMGDPKLEEEEGVEMDFGKPKNPFELPNGGLRIPLPSGGIFDLPPPPVGSPPIVLNEEMPDVGMEEEEGEEMDFGKPKNPFDIPTQGVSKGGSLPKEVDDVFLKKNPTLMSMYYKDPITGKFKLRNK